MPQLSNGYVFMSYSRRDSSVMLRVAAFLRKQGIKVWVDNEKLTPGTPIWEEEIEKAIQSASAIIVVLSPDSKGSEWVRREITLADQYGTRVFPVLVGGDEKASISLRLTNRQFVDIRENENTGLVSLETALSEYLQELSIQEQKGKIEGQKPVMEKAKQQAAGRPQAMPRKPASTQQPILMWPVIGIIGLCIMVTGVWGVTFLAKTFLPSQPTLVPSSPSLTLPSSEPSTVPPTVLVPAITAIEPSIMSDKLVGISMPTKNITLWVSAGESMVKELEGMGYQTDLQFADNDIPNQLAQIENMISEGADILVITAIDGTTLSNVLQKAHDAGVIVIAHDRQISNTANVDYYTTFGHFDTGIVQGTQIETALDLKSGKGPFNIELFGGSPSDPAAYQFYNGAMSILQPYIDRGQLVVQSGQMGMDKVSTLNWNSSVAQTRMDNLLSGYYTNKRIDAVLSPNDGISISVLSSLKRAGYCTSSQPCPVLTGQGASVDSVKSIIAGEQTFTVFHDFHELSKQTATMVDAILKGQEVPINDTKTYNNGVKIVPSYLVSSFSVNITNYKKILIDSGYYTADQLK